MSKRPERKIHKFEDKALEAISFLAKAWTAEIKDWLTCSPAEARTLSEASGANALARLALNDDAAAVYDNL